MKTKTMKSMLRLSMVIFLWASFPNETHSQSILGKVKKEIKKSKPKKQTSTSKKSSSNVSTSQKSSPNKSSSSSASSKPKNQNNGEYEGPGLLNYRQIVKHLAFLDNCEESIGSSDCELSTISRRLDVIDKELVQFAERDAEYDLTEFKTAYDKHKQLLNSSTSVMLKELIPIEMMEYNTSSSIYNKIKFFDSSIGGSDLDYLKFNVTLIQSDNGFEWKKKVNTYINDYKNYGVYEAETDRSTGGDEDDEQVFYIAPPKEGKSYGIIRMEPSIAGHRPNHSGIILFGNLSHEELKAEVQKIKILSTNEEAERTSLEKNNVGKIIFSSQEIKRTLSETSLKNKFILGNPIYARIILKEPSNSMRELFIKEGLSPNYQNSWVLLEYYKNGELIGTYESRGFIGYKQGSSGYDKQKLKDEFDKDRSFGEALLESDFYLYNSAAPLWRGLLEKGISNGTYKISLKYYVVHSPMEGRLYKKFISEGSFNLVVNEAGKSKLCSQAKVCKK
ncbi:MAG: hypothetical protein AB3N18_06585 [Allomuricauda sp.]